jgi:glycosyltransferase involved in cell wall biosynthesis
MKRIKPLNILFFTPYAGRTGSEMFLWYMFAHVNEDILKASLISECNGELLNQMPPAIKTFISLKYPNAFTRIKQIAARFIGFDLYDTHILKINKKIKPDFWYLNTVLMTDKLMLAKTHNIPVIMHFHELTSDYGLVGKQQMQLAVDYSTLCIADSKAVYERLKILGAKNIMLQYECIDIGKIKVNQANTKKIKEDLGLYKYSFVWLMSGTSSTRKGIDMVPELAKYLKEQNAALVWLGNNSTTGMDWMIEQEITVKKLDNVFFLGKKVNDYYDYMNVMDGFVLTSREEPFGMVVVEALALGKPIVSFNAGGVSEIVTPETGRIVDSWNVDALANTMKEVALNKIGFDAEKAKARANDFDVTNQVKNWETILANLVK